MTCDDLNSRVCLCGDQQYDNNCTWDETNKKCKYSNSKICKSPGFKYKDLTFVMSFFVQLWMYASPIVYPLSIVPEKYMIIFVLNPMTSVVECFRGAFLDGAFTVPGDGCIDYKPLFDILKKQNYSSWLVVEAEQDPKKANPFEYAKKGYAYLSKTAKDSGFSIK